MINFKEYLEEKWISGKPVDTGVISGKELSKHISKAKLKNIATHKYHRLYAQHPEHATGYRYTRDDHGFEHVEAGHGQPNTEKDGSKTYHKVRFDLSNSGKVSNAHVFKNVNKERFKPEHGGNLIWRHSHSDKESE